jgi:hypothetical protein
VFVAADLLAQFSGDPVDVGEPVEAAAVQDACTSRGGDTGQGGDLDWAEPLAQQ